MASYIRRYSHFDCQFLADTGLRIYHHRNSICLLHPYISSNHSESCWSWSFRSSLGTHFDGWEYRCCFRELVRRPYSWYKRKLWIIVADFGTVLFPVVFIFINGQQRSIQKDTDHWFFQDLGLEPLFDIAHWIASGMGMKDARKETIMYIMPELVVLFK